MVFLFCDQDVTMACPRYCLGSQLTKDRYKQHDHQYQPGQQRSTDPMMLGNHDSEMTFELLHHILAVAEEKDLMLLEAIPLQIAQKLRARALNLKTSCVNQKNLPDCLPQIF